MRRTFVVKLLVTALLLSGASAIRATEVISESGESQVTRSADTGWIELFNGKDLTNWKVAEHPESFTVKDGVIVAVGERAHAFYVGPVSKGDFKNFELKVEVLTKPGSNSGVFFHTKYQEEGWPEHGYEVQINNTQGDRIKTGSLYAVQNLLDESPTVDNEWFTLHFIVRGKRVVVKVNDKVVNDFTEPAEPEVPKDRPHRRLSHGTIALQGHDPDSEVHYRSIRIKRLD